jgi:hypothetical protein
MKEETELFYLFRLYNSKYLKKGFSTPDGATLFDFEEVCFVNPRNKPFRTWLKGLKILKEVDSNDNNKRYVLIEKSVLNLISNHKLYLRDVKTPAYAEYEGFFRH